VDSRYVIQLASLRDRASANDTWTRINSAHSSLFPASAYVDIVQANIEGKGIYHRVRLAGLSGKPDADRICNQLKARNQTCFVTTR